MTPEYVAQAKREIADLLARYTWSGDFADAEGFASCFTQEGVLEVKGQATYSGRSAIAAMVLARPHAPRSEQSVDSTGPLHHHVSSVQITLDDESHARVLAYFLVMGPSGPDHWGRYTDRVEKQAGAWLFRHRRASADGLSDAARARG